MLCDFGIARILSEDVPGGLTTTSRYMGSERYISYELVTAVDLYTPTTASDIYSLACIGLEVSRGDSK
jgi:serine/threonine protein kinase